MATKKWNNDDPVQGNMGPSAYGELWKLWPYALAFAVMCYVYAGCKLAGLAWAAERPWGEVIAFLCVATVIFVLFFLRKKILFLIWQRKMKKKK